MRSVLAVCLLAACAASPRVPPAAQRVEVRGDAWTIAYRLVLDAPAAPNPQGKVPEIVGDKMTVYFRVLDAATGQRFPENDAFFAYALLRKAKNLGGECAWRRYAMDADPEADKMCGKQK